MPLYEINHTYALSDAQKDALAEAITRIHTTLFKVPSLFVHVVYHDIGNTVAYMAGKKRQSNIIKANVRSGPSRTEEHFQSLCASIKQSWTSIVGEASSEDRKLRAIFVLGSIVAVWEGGFMVPPAGQDQEWLREHLPELKEAAQTDHDVRDMLIELQTRDDF